MQRGRLVVVFYPLGHPIPYASGFEKKKKIESMNYGHR
jgi:hypothetical protein